MVINAPGKIRVHVINLDRSEKRRSWMARELAQCPFEWSFAKATDGMAVSLQQIKGEMTPQFFSRLQRHDASDVFLRGTYGCAMSHATLQTQIAEKKWPEPWHLVLEDDVSVESTLWSILPDLIRRAEQAGKWQLLVGMSWFWGLGFKEPVLYKTATGHELRNMPSQGVNGAFGYLLTPACAQYLVDKQSPELVEPADHWPNLLRPYLDRVGIVTPHLVTTGGFRSDISHNKNTLKTFVRTYGHRVPILRKVMDSRLRHIAKKKR